PEPAEGKPAEEKPEPATEAVVEEKPAEEKPAEEPAAADKPVEEAPAAEPAEKPAEESPAETVAEEKPAEEAPAAEVAAEEKSAEDEPTTEEKPAEEKPTEEPAAEASAAEKEPEPAEEKPVEEAPVVAAADEEKATEDSPAAEEKPAEEAPAAVTDKEPESAEKPAEEAPAEEKPAEEKPAEEAPAVELAEKSTEEAAAPEAAPEEKPAEEAPAAEKEEPEEAPSTDDKPEEQATPADVEATEEAPAAEPKPEEEAKAAEEGPADEEPAAEAKPEEDSKPADDKPEEETAAPEEKPDDDAKPAEEAPAAPADEAKEEAVTEQPAEEAPATEEAARAAPEEPPAEDATTAPAEDAKPAEEAPSTDEKPADDVKAPDEEAKPAEETVARSAETDDKPAEQEPPASEEDAKPAEEAPAPEPEDAATKSPPEPEEPEPAPEPEAEKVAEAEKKDDEKARAEAEAKAKEEEESKDTLGPIPGEKKQAKKGEERHSLNDTPFDFPQRLGLPATELQEDMDHGVLELLSDDTQGQREIPPNEDDTALTPIAHEPSQPRIVEAADERDGAGEAKSLAPSCTEDDQTITEITMPGLHEPSSGQNTNIGVAEDPTRSEPKAEVLGDVEEPLVTRATLGQDGEETTGQAEEQVAIETCPAAKLTPESGDDAKQQLPNEPSETAPESQEAAVEAPEHVVPVVANEPDSVAEADGADLTASHAVSEANDGAEVPAPQTRGATDQSTDAVDREVAEAGAEPVNIYMEQPTSPEAHLKEPADDTHDGNEQADGMDVNLPIPIANDSSASQLDEREPPVDQPETPAAVTSDPVDVVAKSGTTDTSDLERQAISPETAQDSDIPAVASASANIPDSDSEEEQQVTAKEAPDSISPGVQLEEATESSEIAPQVESTTTSEPTQEVSMLGLLQALPAADTTLHEPKILDTDFENVLQLPGETPQSRAVSDPEPEKTEAIDNDFKPGSTTPELLPTAVEPQLEEPAEDLSPDAKGTDLEIQEPLTSVSESEEKDDDALARVGVLSRSPSPLSGADAEEPRHLEPAEEVSGQQPEQLESVSRASSPDTTVDVTEGVSHPKNLLHSPAISTASEADKDIPGTKYAEAFDPEQQTITSRPASLEGTPGDSEILDLDAQDDDKSSREDRSAPVAHTELAPERVEGGEKASQQHDVMPELEKATASSESGESDSRSENDEQHEIETRDAGALSPSSPTEPATEHVTVEVAEPEPALDKALAQDSLGTDELAVAAHPESPHSSRASTPDAGVEGDVAGDGQDPGSEPRQTSVHPSGSSPGEVEAAEITPRAVDAPVVEPEPLSRSVSPVSHQEPTVLPISESEYLGDTQTAEDLDTESSPAPKASAAPGILELPSHEDSEEDETKAGVPPSTQGDLSQEKDELDTTGEEAPAQKAIDVTAEVASDEGSDVESHASDSEPPSPTARTLHVIIPQDERATPQPRQVSSPELEPSSRTLEDEEADGGSESSDEIQSLLLELLESVADGPIDDDDSDHDEHVSGPVSPKTPARDLRERALAGDESPSPLFYRDSPVAMLSPAHSHFEPTSGVERRSLLGLDEARSPSRPSSPDTIIEVAHNKVDLSEEAPTVEPLSPTKTKVDDAGPEDSDDESDFVVLGSSDAPAHGHEAHRDSTEMRDKSLPEFVGTETEIKPVEVMPPQTRDLPSVGATVVDGSAPKPADEAVQVPVPAALAPELVAQPSQPHEPEWDSSSCSEDEEYNTAVEDPYPESRSLHSMQPQQDAGEHYTLSGVDTREMDDDEDSDQEPTPEAKPREAAELQPTSPSSEIATEHEAKPMELLQSEASKPPRVVEIPPRDKGKAVEVVRDSPKKPSPVRSSLGVGAVVAPGLAGTRETKGERAVTRPSRAEPPRTFLTQQQRPRRSLRIRPGTEIYTKDPIFMPVTSRVSEARPVPRPFPLQTEGEASRTPVRPMLRHRTFETQGESSRAAAHRAQRPRSLDAKGESPRAAVQVAPRPRSLEIQGASSRAAASVAAGPRHRSFQAEGESTMAPVPVRPELRHPATTIEEGLRRRDVAHSGPSSPTDHEGIRPPTPGIVIPDTDMIDLQRAHTLRRKRKMSIQRAEDTVAAAVVIYAAAEALSPPSSPQPLLGHHQEEEEEEEEEEYDYDDDDAYLPNLEHQMTADPENSYFPVSSSPRRSFEDALEELYTSDADWFADDRSRESDSSRSDRDRDRHHRRRRSHRSHHSSRSRDEEGKERRSSRGEDEKRAHRSRDEDESRRRRRSHRDEEGRSSRRHRDDEEPRSRGSRGEGEARVRSSRGVEEPKSRSYRREEEPRSRGSRAPAEESSSRALPREEEPRERTRRSSHGAHSHRRYRPDSAGSGTPGTPPRTPRRDSGFSAEGSSGSSGRRRRTPDEQAAHDKRKAERAERRAREKEPERKREPSRLRESPREEAKDVKGKGPDLEPEPERRHRRSRRHSHSGRPRPDDVRDRPSTAERDESIAPAPAPRRRFFGVKLADNSPPAREEPTVAEPIRERAKESPPVEAPKRTRSKYRRPRESMDEARPRSRRTRDEPVPDPPRDRDARPSRHVRMDTEDSRRKARHEERRKAQAKEEEKKPGGIKAAFKKLFG
ncbi:hypothetical protein CEP54_009040, partial [Fusarium duplospermum]